MINGVEGRNDNVFAFGVFINLVFCCEMLQFDLFRPEIVIKFNHLKKGY